MHGRFMECAQCGDVRKAFTEDYMNPIAGEMVVVYGVHHGRKKQPGHKNGTPQINPQSWQARFLLCQPLHAPSASEPPSKKSQAPLPLGPFGQEFQDTSLEPGLGACWDGGLNPKPLKQGESSSSLAGIQRCGDWTTQGRWFAPAVELLGDFR